MRLALVCGKQKFTFARQRIIGRTDFPDQQMLSRKHFEIRHSEDGRVFVMDLGSANGTTLRGSRLTPNVSVELKTDDLLNAGGLTFSLIETPPTKLDRKYLGVAGIFIVLMILLLAQPSMAFGRATGFWGVVTMVVGLAIPLAGATWFFDRVSTMSGKSWSLPKFLIAVMVATMVLNDGMVALISSTTNIDRVVAVNKIHYFCLSNFSAARCVKQITSCPQCAGFISTNERQAMADRLRAFYRQPAAIPQTSK